MINNLKAAIRDTKTKSDLNSLRSKGFIPAVLYGGKSPNLKLSIEEKFIKDVTKIEERIIRIGEIYGVKFDTASSIFREEPKDIVAGFLALPGEIGIPGFPKYEDVKEQTDKIFNKDK